MERLVLCVVWLIHDTNAPAVRITAGALFALHRFSRWCENAALWNNCQTVHMSQASKHSSTSYFISFSKYLLILRKLFSLKTNHMGITKSHPWYGLKDHCGKTLSRRKCMRTKVNLSRWAVMYSFPVLV